MLLAAAAGLWGGGREGQRGLPFQTAVFFSPRSKLPGQDFDPDGTQVGPTLSAAVCVLWGKQALPRGCLPAPHTQLCSGQSGRGDQGRAVPEAESCSELGTGWWPRPGSSLGAGSLGGWPGLPPPLDSCPDLGPKEKGESCQAVAKETRNRLRLEETKETRQQNTGRDPASQKWHEGENSGV